jgi:integrase
MSRQRAEELTRIKTDLQTKFAAAVQANRLADASSRPGLWLRALFECAHTYGWRHEELLGLRVRQVSLASNSIRLEPHTTKNDDGREVTMTSSVRQLLAQCIHGQPGDAFVFRRPDGKAVRDFRTVWANVCVEAGLGQFWCRQCSQPVDEARRCASCAREWKRNELKYVGLIFHSLRRTAARNLRNAGVAEGIVGGGVAGKHAVCWIGAVLSARPTSPTRC